MILGRDIHLEKAVYHSVWLATPALYKAVVNVFEAHKSRLKAGIKEELAEFVNQRSEYEGLDDNGIAVIHVCGVLGNKMSNMEKACGATDYSDVSEEIDEALSEGAKGFMFCIDSGGGMVNGCSELASKIASLEVPSVAYTDGMTASAAYWVASACDMIFASESAEVGSIGVIIPWVDQSAAWGAAGLKFDPITNQGATQKGAMFGPSITPEQRASLQGSVNAIADKFHAAVQLKRDVDPSVFDASMHFAQDAVDKNLIDASGTIDDAYDNLFDLIQESDSEDNDEASYGDNGSGSGDDGQNDF